MASVLTEAQSVSEAPIRKRWTREELAQLEHSNLCHGERFELIEGDLYLKMGKKRPHVVAATLIRLWLEQHFGGEFLDAAPSMNVAPEDNPTSEPEPGLVVLTKPSWEIHTNPEPSEIRLAIEVSDSTLRFDLTRKAALYARAGIVEYWVAEVPNQALVVHQQPRNGAYQSIRRFIGHDTVESGAIPTPFPVADLFEPPPINPQRP